MRDRATKQRPSRPETRDARPSRVCPFCAESAVDLSYQHVDALKRHLGESGKITSRRFTNVCSRHQRALAVAVKQARFLALVPYTDKHRLGYEG